MKIQFVILTVCLLSLYSLPVISENGNVITATSPPHRVALLELYTSEGCSSCPPADRWLSRLKDSAVTGRQLVPLAFHVTYWDYIGWKDRFASPEYDQRQRRQATLADSRTVYTPQFVLNGRDFRNVRRLDSELRKINDESAALDLRMTLISAEPDSLDVRIDVDSAGRQMNDIAVHIALYENGLGSDVSDGENEGEHLQHDFVVRRFYSTRPEASADGTTTVSKSIQVENNWRRENMGLVAFAQDMDSGEVLQTVSHVLHARALADLAR